MPLMDIPKPDASGWPTPPPPDDDDAEAAELIRKQPPVNHEQHKAERLLARARAKAKTKIMVRKKPAGKKNVVQKNTSCRLVGRR